MLAICLQTAQLSFGLTHPLIPTVAHELCRERIAKYTSEGRANTSVLKKDWPKVDFSLIEHETDPMFAFKEQDEQVCPACFVGSVFSSADDRHIFCFEQGPVQGWYSRRFDLLEVADRQRVDDGLLKGLTDVISSRALRT